jgi:hypothetical protein
VEGKARHPAVWLADALPGAAHADLAAHRARGVLDDRQPVLVGNGQDGRQVAWEPELVHDQNRAGGAGERGLQQTRVHAIGRRIDVHEDGPGPYRDDRVGGRDEAVADRDHIVFAPDVHRPQGQLQAGCATGHGDRVLGAYGVGELAFERRYLGALRDPTRAQHGADRRDLGLAQVGPHDGDLHPARILRLSRGFKFLMAPARYARPAGPTLAARLDALRAYDTRGGRDWRVRLGVGWRGPTAG